MCTLSSFSSRSVARGTRTRGWEHTSAQRAARCRRFLVRQEWFGGALTLLLPRRPLPRVESHKGNEGSVDAQQREQRWVSTILVHPDIPGAEEQVPASVRYQVYTTLAHNKGSYIDVL